MVRNWGELDEAVVDSLMVTLLVVMRSVFSDDSRTPDIGVSRMSAFFVTTVP